MKLRPTIFLSGVSSEFRSFRDAAEIEIQKKGCFPVNQSSLGVDYREIEEILRAKLIEADAVVHIVGFRFGFEPRNRPAGKLRRSYTQMEYDIARELGKAVYVFLSADATIRDSEAQPEDAEAVELQLAHRRAVTERSDNIHYTFRNNNELCNLVAGIPLLANADFRVDISRIDKYAPTELIGREDELKLLDDAWLKVRRAEPKRPHILTFVALGGEGKTSLVAKWAAQLAYENWPGCDSAFAWSFYSQGTREQYASSSDLFLKEAITFVGNDDDKQFAASNAGAYEKGQRLARIVGQRRALLILDGLEPLQYAPTSPTPGELKDGGIVALLKGLAAHSNGLCIVTTRYSLPNLKTFRQTTAPEIRLTRLSQLAGIHLLKTLGVNGSTKEFETLVEDVKGHALTLNLLGTYLRDAHGGDIRRRDLIKLEEADAEEQGGHAFRVTEAYGDSFEKEGEKGKRALAILQILGLFDRPMSANCLEQLLEEPVIVNLTEPLVGLSEAQLNITFKRLEDAKLLTVKRETSRALSSLDAHPLVREYFARQLRTQQVDSWRAAHRRLYEHLCATTPDKDKPTLEDLEPLYQAVAHGSNAGLEQGACEDVYRDRILRGLKHYTWYSLGVYGSELGAQACFFETPWSCVSSRIREATQAWLLNEAGVCLCASGRLTEALEAMRASLKLGLKQKNWKAIARRTNNLSQLELMLGDVAGALRDAEQSVTYAERSGESFDQVMNRCAHADALHHAGKRAEAEKRFREAEKILTLSIPEYPLLYGLAGFQYCDLLLGDPERATWQRTLNGEASSLHSNALRDISQRPKQTIEWRITQEWLLAVALDHLTLSRAVFYETVLGSTGFPLNPESKLRPILDNAVSDLRSAGTMDELPRGLLTRSWLRFLIGPRTGAQSAQEDLDEAWEIAERGPMKLFMADIHLYRARLFFREKEYPWESPEADLQAARKLIEQCGYWRRKEELEDAERIILKKSV